MNLTVVIPDDVAGRFSEAGASLSRRMLEAWAADEYRNDRLTEYTTEDAERERRGLERLGFLCGWLWPIPARSFTFYRLAI